MLHTRNIFLIDSRGRNKHKQFIKLRVTLNSYWTMKQDENRDTTK